MIEIKMYQMLRLLRLQRVAVIVTLINAFVLYSYILSSQYKRSRNFTSDGNDEDNNKALNFGTYSNNRTGFHDAIVPNIVHQLRIANTELTFVEMINIRSIFDNHNPTFLLIHCLACPDQGFTGKYWEMLGAKYRKKIRVIPTEIPKQIFGIQISGLKNMLDITRINVLRKYGGIYLDSDVFVVQTLNKFRHFEMTLEWNSDVDTANLQVIVVHKNARLLKRWWESYRFYDGTDYYEGAYNLMEFLRKDPGLIHRMKLLFGMQLYNINLLYKSIWREWGVLYTLFLHTSASKQVMELDGDAIDFDEFNIRTYNRSFGEIARIILYGRPDIIN